MARWLICGNTRLMMADWLSAETPLGASRETTLKRSNENED